MKLKFNGRDCKLKVETYLTTGRPALTLYDARDGSYVALGTANFGDVPLKPNQVLIKDHDENTDMLRTLVKAGVVQPTGVLESGWNEFPICELLVTERHETQLDPLLRKAMDEVKTVTEEGRANGIPYAALDRDGKQELLAVGIDWNPYIEEGVEVAQIDRIIDNAVDGKPPERWLEGAAPAGQDAYDRMLDAHARKAQSHQAAPQPDRELEP